MEDRGPAAYVAEFIGTLLLVLFIAAVVSLFVQAPDPQQPAPFIDWTVIGLVHAFLLLVLIQTLAVVSGAHFNPAVTSAMLALRQIKPPDALIYMVAQFAGAVAGALIVKLLLTDFPNADLVLRRPGGGRPPRRQDRARHAGGVHRHVHAGVCDRWRGARPAGGPGARPLVIGGALGLGVMVIGPLTGAGLNPARSFGPALVSGEFGGAGQFLLVYFLAPVIGAVLAAVAYFNIFVARREGRGGEWSRSGSHG